MPKLLTNLCGVSIITLMVACNDSERNTSKDKENSQDWWQLIEPELVIDSHEFYAAECKITKIDTSTQEAQLIFQVPTSPLETCTHRDDTLTFDGEYIILDVCVMAFGAGGCLGGRYRSKDYKHWEEYIGVTWIKEEAYEAWRTVGTTSDKANSLKKLE